MGSDYLHSDKLGRRDSINYFVRYFPFFLSLHYNALLIKRVHLSLRYQGRVSIPV